MIGLKPKTIWLVWVATLVVGNLTVFAWSSPAAPAIYVPPLPEESPKEVAVVTPKPEPDVPPVIATPPMPIPMPMPKAETPKAKVVEVPKKEPVVPVTPPVPPKPKSFAFRPGTEDGVVLIVVLAQRYADNQRKTELLLQMREMQEQFGKELLGRSVFVIDRKKVMHANEWVSQGDAADAFVHGELQRSLEVANTRLKELIALAKHPESVFPIIICDSTYKPEEDQTNPPWTVKMDAPIPGFFWMRNTKSETLERTFPDRLCNAPQDSLTRLAVQVQRHHAIWTKR